MTIYDIAKEAGVSASTVSRVINGKPGIGEKTRKKIQNLLKKYNYIPNEAARSLSTSETRLIGILLEDIRNVHHALIAYTLEQALTARGYAGIILNTGPSDSSKEKYVRLLTARNVDGVNPFRTVRDSGSYRQRMDKSAQCVRRARGRGEGHGALCGPPVFRRSKTYRLRSCISYPK